MRPQRKRKFQKVAAVNKLWVNQTEVALNAGQMSQLISAIVQHTDVGLALGVVMPEEVRRVLMEVGVEVVATGTWMLSANDNNDDLNIVVTPVQ